MNKFNNLKSLVVVLIIGCFVVFVTIFMRSCDVETDINAKLSSANLVAGEEFIYSDNTRNAHTWLWEFGNGDMSNDESGKYKYNEPGVYRIRLTVDGTNEKTFEVTVKENTDNNTFKLAQIQAPESAMQGEFVVFKAEGSDKQWRWMFGETGLVDSREQSPIYAFSEPGVYLVELHTENTQYPVTHLIEIHAHYSEDDPTDKMSIIGADIRERLQAIADGKSFNNNYNYIITNYLCGNQKVEVKINNNKYNEIYSYCQGLRMTSNGKTNIDMVVVDIPNLATGCVTRINVIQSEK